MHVGGCVDLAHSIVAIRALFHEDVPLHQEGGHDCDAHEHKERARIVQQSDPVLRVQGQRQGSAYVHMVDTEQTRRLIFKK
jgi:hypothetical protein